jgi:tetratricopeptide (TPR) repeat protein
LATEDDHRTVRHRHRLWIRAGWIAAFVTMAAVRLWNAFTGPLLRGYDDLGHAGYILYLDLYRSVPWADQGWSYFHPPLHYMVGWALAQFDSSVVLLRGLALLGGAASLAIAAMAARITRLVYPSRDDLALLAFVAVGLLPVYLYTSTMAGNELTAAFFGTLGLTLLIANECRNHPGLGPDALAGLAIGLALLTKVSAVLVLGVAAATLGLRALRERPLAASLRRSTLRGLVLVGLAVAIASPYYARNVREFGTPFKMSRDNPDVARLESSQEPGSRTWVDFVALPPKLLLDPDPRKEHLLHSVWGSAYAQMWADSRSSWNHLGARHQPQIRKRRSLMAILGIGPTLLALVGGVLGFLDVRRGSRASVYVPLFASTAVNLASFAYFAVAAPQFSALKASYLLGLTLPYAVFLARGVEALGRIASRAGAILGATLVALPSLAGAFVYADGVVLPRLGNPKAISALLFYFGDHDGHSAARRFYEDYRDSPRRKMWTDNLGAVALVEGDPARARSLFGLYPPKPGRDRFRWNAYGVATALSGAREHAVEIFTQAIDAGAGEVGLVNRGAARASLGDLDAAESDLREALGLNARLAPAWHGLAEVLERSGRTDEAAAARESAERAARGGPRGYPYGIPNGLGQHPSARLDFRWMLWLDGEDLLLARAPFRAADAIPMRDRRSSPIEGLTSVPEAEFQSGRRP